MVVYPDHIIDSMYVLVSAFRSSDGNVVPVKLEVKKNVHNNDSLYIVVTHGDKTKNRTFAPASGAGENIVSHTRHSNKSSSVITIPQILSSVNSNFEGFVKYFPDELLSVNQQLQKKKDIADEAAYIERKRQEEWKKKEGLYNKAVANKKRTPVGIRFTLLHILKGFFELIKEAFFVLIVFILTGIGKSFQKLLLLC